MTYHHRLTLRRAIGAVMLLAAVFGGVAAGALGLGRPTPKASAAAINFIRRTVFTATSPGGALLDSPTTLAVGPDGRVYVGQQNGRIHVLTLDAVYNVTAVQVINTIYNT